MSKEPDVLELHGTTAGGLKPGSIVSAAEADLRRRIENKSGERPAGGYHHYAFHRAHVAHVSKADQPTVAALIMKALAEPEIGTSSGKRSTRLIYKDQAILQEALQIATNRGL